MIISLLLYGICCIKSPSKNQLLQVLDLTSFSSRQVLKAHCVSTNLLSTNSAFKSEKKTKSCEIRICIKITSYLNSNCNSYFPCKYCTFYHQCICMRAWTHLGWYSMIKSCLKWRLFTDAIRTLFLVGGNGMHSACVTKKIKMDYSIIN